MSLKTRYTQEDDIVSLSAPGRERSDEGSYEVESDSWTVLDVAFDNGCKPVTLELIFVSRLMPLETNKGYSSDTDTLVIGEGLDTATVVEVNGDLTAYWCPDDDLDDMNLVAVSIRNASKHLAPLIDHISA